jgi:hypothetical protein
MLSVHISKPSSVNESAAALAMIGADTCCASLMKSEHPAETLVDCTAESRFRTLDGVRVTGMFAAGSQSLSDFIVFKSIPNALLIGSGAAFLWRFGNPALA